MSEPVQHISNKDTDLRRALVCYETSAGLRLDVFLARALDIGRAQVKRLLSDGRVELNGRFIRESDKSRTIGLGDTVTIEGPASARDQRVVPNSSLAIEILASGAGWIAVNKPAGLSVHPLRLDETDTVMNGVVALYPQVQGIGEGGLRSGVVHRLDVDTSGVLLVATSDDAWKRLRVAIGGRAISKRYRAIVAGQLRGQRREEMTLTIARHQPAFVRVIDTADVPPGSRRCHLNWRAVKTFSAGTLIEIDLGTGFLHQIRVMMSQIGHPILGDRAYAPAAIAAAAPRQMLHAAQLDGAQFDPPISAAAADPADFSALLNQLR